MPKLSSSYFTSAMFCLPVASLRCFPRLCTTPSIFLALLPTPQEFREAARLSGELRALSAQVGLGGMEQETGTRLGIKGFRAVA